MDLNPIANASLKVAKEFADVVVNASSTLADSSHATAWKIAQRVSTELLVQYFFISKQSSKRTMLRYLFNVVFNITFSF